MSRALSLTAINALMAESTDEAFLMLMTITYTPPVGEPEIFRCVLNTEDITSRSSLYTATYFDINLPEDGDRAPAGAQITIDNADLKLVKLLRRITRPLAVVIEVVLASQPDVVEMVLEDLVLREVDWDLTSITGTLMSEDVLNQAFPGDIYEPRTFPGLF